MTGFIYYLQNPLTKEPFYVGSTQISLRNRLRTHYQHLKEMIKGKRKTNRRYEYLQSLLPHKADIVLLELVTEDNSLDEREQYFIDLFRNINPNLTNMTDGGRGQDTYKYQYTEDQIIISQKISHANKGKSKPEGFAANMSITRMGINNPMAGKSSMGWIVCFNHDIPIRMFKYGFEINNFLGSKHAYGNVHRVLKNNLNHSPYDYIWKRFEDCNKEIQDIVESTYES